MAGFGISRVLGSVRLLHWRGLTRAPMKQPAKPNRVAASRIHSRLRRTHCGGEVRRAMRLVTEQQILLLARWRELHERTD
jgi:hypothetical protein